MLLLDPWAKFFGDTTPASWFCCLRFGQSNYFYGRHSAGGISGWFSAEFVASIYIWLIKHTSSHTILELHFVLRWWYSAHIFCLQCLVSVDNLNPLPHCVVPNRMLHLCFYSALLCKRCTSYGNSVCLSVRLSVCRSAVRPSHGIVSKRRHVARCSFHCRIAKCVQFCKNQKYSLGTTPSPWNLRSNWPTPSW